MKELLLQFVQMVKDLAKPGELILTQMKATSMHLIHMILGAIGEVAELKEACLLNDRTNVVEELGDYEFYLQGIYQGLEAGPRTIPTDGIVKMKSSSSLCDDLLISTGNLLDKIKRLTMYGKSVDTEEILSLADICRHQLDQFYTSNTMDITREEVLEGNMNKLLKGDKARYKSGSYSDDQANARADKVEEPEVSQPALLPSTPISITFTLSEIQSLEYAISKFIRQSKDPVESQLESARDKLTAVLD